MKLTVLAENTARDSSLRAEHGLSLLIESLGRRVLLDFGQSDALVHNAEVLGTDLSTVDCAVLSHGHYDHGGGISAFRAVNRTAPIYLSSQAFGAHYNAKGAYIGLDASLRSDGGIVEVCDHAGLWEGAEVFSPRFFGPLSPDPSVPLYRREADGTLRPDLFGHELFLLLREGERRVLFTGCAHSGLSRLLEWFEFDVLVGGFHLSKLDASLPEGRDALDRVCRSLGEKGASYYTCHCTGTEQGEYLRARVPSVSLISTGDVLYL